MGKKYSLYVVWSFAVATALAGCSNSFVDQGPWAYTFGGGPPPDPKTEIRSLSGTEDSYPKLGTTPPRPTDMTTAQERDKEMQGLANARTANRDAEKALRAANPDLIPVPPQPKITTPDKKAY